MKDTDRLAIHELMARYGHVLDERRWDQLEILFTAAAVCDFRGAAAGRMFNDLQELRTFWSSPEGEAVHPLAHHITNVVVTPLDEHRANVVSKGIGVGKNGRVGSVTYEDVVVRTGTGWRIAARTAQLRRPPAESAG